MTWGETLAYRRGALGWSQERLAQQLGITRQTLIALEHDKRLPTLALAIKLASLFDLSLDELVKPLANSIERTDHWRWFGAKPSFPTLVVWAKIHDATVLVPTMLLAAPRLPDALWNPESGVLTPLPSARDPQRVMLIGGCDPYLAWLRDLYEEKRPGYWMEPIRLSSQAAIAAFTQGLLHVAGSHLFDASTGQYNLIDFPMAVTRLHYLTWDEGLIRHPEATEVRQIAIREPGSEAHSLFLRHQGRISWPPDMFYSHQSILEQVQHHPDWAGVGLGSLAATCGLIFEAWAQESYDLWIRTENLKSVWGRTLLEVLASTALHDLFSQIPHLALSGS